MLMEGTENSQKSHEGTASSLTGNATGTVVSCFPALPEGLN